MTSYEWPIVGEALVEPMWGLVVAAAVVRSGLGITVERCVPVVRRSGMTTVGVVLWSRERGYGASREWGTHLVGMAEDNKPFLHLGHYGLTVSKGEADFVERATDNGPMFAIAEE